MDFSLKYIHDIKCLGLEKIRKDISGKRYVCIVSLTLLLKSAFSFTDSDFIIDNLSQQPLVCPIEPSPILIAKCLIQHSNQTFISLNPFPADGLLVSHCVNT